MHEAKTRLSKLLAEIEKGEQFVITRRGVSLARLVAAAPATARRAKGHAQRERVNQVFAAMAQLRSGTVLDVPMKDAIDQGRD
ncbi:MAG: type II toxin-antitoxin system prevent-host-death family antitoxin [Rubrivivax sp.]|nr:type II toxin-antitoxin system prevent-host-death family antitoxin [Rubrivivax sp.]MDP3221884.1 type II toxin-antitoxin system prevent-host-death family antitoxin [Rubrivivax sp.]MDP3611578.1 type II toxin-antitoxin system prevent-host-death family antitoxin [Rubrivivax sp.]